MDEANSILLLMGRRGCTGGAWEKMNEGPPL